MDDHKGPYTLTHSEQVCSFCEYLHTKVDRYGTFSNDSRYYCMNPSLVSPNLPARIQVVEQDRGRYIGTEDRTPAWCPFLQSNAPMIGGKSSE